MSQQHPSPSKNQTRSQQMDWLDQRKAEAEAIGIKVKWANDGHIVFVATEPNEAPTASAENDPAKSYSVS